MKFKKTLVITLLFILSLSIPTFASNKEKSPVFMGKVLEVTKDEKDNSVRVKGKGYIKGCSVYEEELILIVTKDTEIIGSKCGNEEKYENEVCVGDLIFAKLDKAMTKSIPPQVVAKKIQISKVNK
ncbi:Uncharacterised protein [uncultured Clostridium sp.]|uniref:hypothetical protein n=1 Tax=uncultured Clostridium sp. TaxID=59620 RepID=UPI000821BB19|nr:hypothetical protein [uncultured Clostridium sp.]SCJ99199.1 Uncharacterised protein [uncultured Clostridium sp.]